MPMPSVQPRKVVFSRPAISPSDYVSLMDEHGRWREVPVKTLPSLPYSLRMKITPEIAANILAERNVQNRQVDRRRVAKYVSDMLTNKWHVHGNGIQFNRAGNLVDGQHRLHAVVDSEISVDFMVCFGVEDDAVVAIDEGRPRSSLDVARIMGMEGVSRMGMSTGAYMLEYKGLKEKRSRSDILNYYQTHSEAISFVTGRLTNRNLQKAPLFAVLTRAYYHCKTDPWKLARLERFMELLQKSSVELVSSIERLPEEDVAPITLRDYLDRSRDKNTGTFRKEMYRKTQSALVYFLKREPIYRLYGLKDEQFPLSEESHEVAV